MKRKRKKALKRYLCKLDALMECVKSENRVMKAFVARLREWG